ncbi:MAG: serine/threonine-protein phosphatase [Deltaproteobacteria bacterium]|nr:serine/threonine-protein phosphatase [Deltaproteobacteria bacterium]
MIDSPLHVHVTARTDAGRVREQNEDCFLIVDLDSGTREADGAEWSVGDRGVLLAVSDGIGGAAAGEVASALSIEALWHEIEQESGEGDVADKLERVVVRANRRVRDAARTPGRRGMGATLTAALLCGRAVHLAQIGDSRAYLLRGGQLRQVTRDQSYVQKLVDEGALTPEEAERSPDRNVILQAMGQANDVRVALGHLTVRPGDRVLLCSDGLTNAVSDEDIARIAQQAVEAACAALIDAANAAGGPDNITVVLAEVA